MKQSVEARKIASLARQYENEGYEVVVQPSRSVIPALTYSPDLIVRRGNDVVLIEVVSSKSSKEKQNAIEFFAKYAAEQKGVRFDLVVTNPRVTKGQRQNRDSILLKLLQQHLAKELDETVESHPVAAVIICCILVESLLRGLANHESDLQSRNVPLVQLARQLEEREIISRSASNFIAELWQARSAALHSPTDRARPPGVRAIYEKTKSLLRDYKRDSYL